MNTKMRVDTLLLCTLAGIVNCIVGTSLINVTSSTILRTLCNSYNVCRNGECYVVGSTTQCICGALFSGSRCERVKLSAASYATIGTLVIFQWPRPPRLTSYSFVYYETDADAEDRIIFKQDIKMKDTEMSALVRDLKSSHTSYRICIEDFYTAELAVNTNSVERLSNCLLIKTEMDYFTIAGYVVAVLLSCVAVFMMFSQREKIEILYFSKTYVPYEKPTAENTPQHEQFNNSNTQLDNNELQPPCGQDILTTNTNNATKT